MVEMCRETCVFEIWTVFGRSVARFCLPVIFFIFISVSLTETLPKTNKFMFFFFTLIRYNFLYDYKRMIRFLTICVVALVNNSIKFDFETMNLSNRLANKLGWIYSRNLVDFSSSSFLFFNFISSTFLCFFFSFI